MIRMTPDAYYQLQNNIDLSAWIEENYPTAGWAPIGTSPKPFTGTFDGNGFTISNLYINRASDCNGLFGYAKNTTVKNLTINCNIKGGGSTGAIIGSCASATLSNCKVEGEIQGTGRTGGFIGDGSTGTYDIQDCSFTGNVNGGLYTGGLIGYIAILTVTNCAVTGEVNGEQYTGGISGCGKELSTTNSYIDGNVRGGDYTGGVIGKITTFVAVDCNLKGKIDGKDYTGGIGGFGESISATNSFFIGEVWGRAQTGGLIGSSCQTTLSMCAIEGSVNGQNCTGGLVGNIRQNTIYNEGTYHLTKIQNCYAKGDIYSNDSYVGGLFGYDNSGFSYTGYGSRYYVNVTSIVEDCYYEGNIFTTGNYVGGISGYATGEYRRCLANGTITGDNYVGGIIGYICGSVNTSGYGYHSTNSILYSCTNLCSELQATKENINRICNKGNYSILGNLGTNTENKTLSNCKIYIGEELQSVEDSPENGYETIPSVMRHAVTYISIDWDFTDVWDIDEGNGYPFLRFRQPTPSSPDYLTLTDAAPAVMKGTFEPGKVTYSRVSGGDYASFCLPFDIDLSEATGIETVYMPMEQIIYNTETEWLMMFLDEQDMTSTVKAGTPFLAKTSDSEVTFSNSKRVSFSQPLSENPVAKTLKVFNFDGHSGVLYKNNTLGVTWGGTYVPTEATEGLNSFNINGSFGQHTGTLNAYRAYVMQTSTAASHVRGIQLNLAGDEGEVTSVFQLLNEPATTEGIYDMTGRRVPNTQQGGLYIINGKKVVK